MQAVKDVANKTTGININQPDRLDKSDKMTLCAAPRTNGKITKSRSRMPGRWYPNKTTSPAVKWHASSGDIGPWSLPIGGNRYAVAFTCAATDVTYLYIIESRSELPQISKQHICQDGGQRATEPRIYGSTTISSSITGLNGSDQLRTTLIKTLSQKRYFLPYLRE